MSGAETVVETVLAACLAGNADVKAVAGNPVRVAVAGAGRPAYPFIELLRHEARPADAQDAPASEHIVEFAVVSRNDGGSAARAGAAAIRSALEAGLAPETGRCVLAAALSVTVAPAGGGLWRAVVRVRVVYEPG